MKSRLAAISAHLHCPMILEITAALSLTCSRIRATPTCSWLYCRSFDATTIPSLELLGKLSSSFDKHSRYVRESYPITETHHVKVRECNSCMNTTSPIGEWVVVPTNYWVLKRICRDCMTLNIMMDPKPMFPDLYHPGLRTRTRDFKGYVHPYSRTARPVKYYWTDFGLSTRFDPEETNPVAVPIIGGDRTVPEYKKDSRAACNPFRVDVYNVGNLIREDFLQVGVPIRRLTNVWLTSDPRYTRTSHLWNRWSRACAMRMLISGL